MDRRAKRNSAVAILYLRMDSGAGKQADIRAHQGGHGAGKGAREARREAEKMRILCRDDCVHNLGNKDMGCDSKAIQFLIEKMALGGDVFIGSNKFVTSLWGEGFNSVDQVCPLFVIKKGSFPNNTLL